MTHVALLMRSSPSMGKSGLYRYATGIQDVSDRMNDVRIEQVDTVFDLKNGYLTLILDGLVRPFFRIMRMRKKVDVFHAADEFGAIFFPFLIGKRKVMTIHHVTTDKDKEVKFPSIWRFVTKLGLIFTDEVIAISPQTKREIIDSFGTDEKKITVIYNSISDSFTTLEVPKRKFIGCVSTLVARKNVSSLMNIFKKFTEMSGTEDYVLKICGDGPEREILSQQADELGISERVEFISGLSEKELTVFYNEMTVLANPSMHEGFGYVTMEAQKCSTPVVVFKDADIPADVIECAVKADDEHDFAVRIHELVNDSELYSETVEKGLRHVAKFDLDFERNMDDVYNRRQS